MMLVWLFAERHVDLPCLRFSLYNNVTNVAMLHCNTLSEMLRGKSSALFQPCHLIGFSVSLKRGGELMDAHQGQWRLSGNREKRAIRLILQGVGARLFVKALFG